MKKASLDIFIQTRKQNQQEAVDPNIAEKITKLEVKVYCPRERKKMEITECLKCPIRDRCWQVPLDFMIAYIMDKKRNQERSRRGLRVSSIASCVYRQYLDEKELVINPQGLPGIIKGQVFHMGLSEFFRNMGEKKFEEEIKAEINGVQVIGHIDMNDDEVLTEVKTTKSRVVSESDLKPYWLAQLATYMHLTGSERGRLLVVSKEMTDIASFRIRIANGDKIRAFIEKAVNGYRKLKNGEEPLAAEVGPLDKGLCAKCHRRSECPYRFKTRYFPMDAVEVQRT